MLKKKMEGITSIKAHTRYCETKQQWKKPKTYLEILEIEYGEIEIK